MTLSEELTWRGFVNQTTFKDISELDTKKHTFYFGADPSAASLTIGNLAAAMMARCFINHGYKAILLVGGATGIIGDPKNDQERKLMTLEEIEKNKLALAAQYRQIFNHVDFDLVDNFDWFKDIQFIPFLRDIGKNFSMTQLLDREFVKSRVGEGKSGLSYAEFSYSLIQGYDFLHLFKSKGATLQLCGADQWGNSISGVDLIRKIENAEAHVWSCPLVINKATGVKFGKSESGAVWLNPELTSPYQFYQFWLNSGDDGVIDYLKIYTLLSVDDIENLNKAAQDNPGDRVAQKALAFEVTKLVHGEDRAEEIQRVTKVLFSNESIKKLSSEDLDTLSAEVPTVKKGNQLVDILTESSLAISNSDARRLIEAGGVTVNGTRVTKDERIEELALVKKGKNSFALVR